MTTVTVLGATGRTGRPLIDRLLEDGYDVRALVRSTSPGLPVHDRLHILTEMRQIQMISNKHSQEVPLSSVVSVPINSRYSRQRFHISSRR